MEPEVSVLMPVKNGERYLAEAVASVLAQSFTRFELLILNDNSTDKTAEIATAFAQRDLRVHHLRVTQSGFAQALNEGLALARAPLVARLDGDDLMVAKRLETQIAVHQADPDLAVSASHIQYIDSHGAPRGFGVAGYHEPEEIQKALESDILIGFHHPSVMFRKAPVLALGGYPLGMWPVEDIDLWTRLAESGHRLRVLPLVLTKYRVHAGSGSRSMDSVIKLNWIKLRAMERRERNAEPTWLEYCDSLKRLGLMARINHIRGNYGKYFFRRATLLGLNRCYLKSGLALYLAFLLKPSHILKRLNKYGRK